MVCTRTEYRVRSECHHDTRESMCVIAKDSRGFPRAGYPVRKAVVVIIRYHAPVVFTRPQLVAELCGGRGGTKHKGTRVVSSVVTRVASSIETQTVSRPLCHSQGLTVHVSCMHTAVIAFEQSLTSPHAPALRLQVYPHVS